MVEYVYRGKSAIEEEGLWRKDKLIWGTCVIEAKFTKRSFPNNFMFSVASSRLLRLNINVSRRQFTSRTTLSKTQNNPLFSRRCLSSEKEAASANKTNTKQAKDVHGAESSIVLTPGQVRRKTSRHTYPSDGSMAHGYRCHIHAN